MSSSREASRPVFEHKRGGQRTGPLGWGCRRSRQCGLAIVVLQQASEAFVAKDVPRRLADVIGGFDQPVAEALVISPAGGCIGTAR
jgi:hypothetical protein